MMMNHDIDEVTRQVSDRVGPAGPAHDPVRAVSATGINLEFDPEPYPEVNAAFDEFCRITGTDARLTAYKVRPVADGPTAKARVTVTVRLDKTTSVADAVADDVVAGSVQAFAAAVSRAA